MSLATAHDPMAASARSLPQVRTRRALVIVCFLAFALRVGFAFNYGLVQQRFTLSKGSDGYEHIATTIVAGYGYRFNADLGETMFLPPVYPLFLASLFLLFGPSLLAVQVVQSLVDAASCLLVYRLTRPAFGSRAGLVGALIYALYPGAWVACARYLTEPLFVFLTLAFVALLAQFIESGRGRRALLAGLTLAAAVLCKSVAGALPVFLAVCVFVLPAWRGVRRRTMSGLLISLLCVGLVSSLWVLRNWMVSGTLVYPASSGGLALYAAHVYAAHPDQRIRDSAHQAAREVRELAEARGIRPDSRDKYPRWFRSPQDEVKVDQLARATARHYILNNRVAFAHHVAGNLWRFWFGGPSARAVIASVLINGSVLLFGLIGVLLHPRRPDATFWLWVCVCAYLFLAHVAVLSVVRYSLTVIPLVCGLSGAGLVALRVRIARRLPAC